MGARLVGRHGVSLEIMASHTLFADRRALEQEIASLGVNIRFENDIQAALKPLAIANRTVGNRFAIHPMEGCDGTLDGAPDELDRDVDLV